MAPVALSPLCCSSLLIEQLEPVEPVDAVDVVGRGILCIRVCVSFMFAQFHWLWILYCVIALESWISVHLVGRLNIKRQMRGLTRLVERAAGRGPILLHLWFFSLIFSGPLWDASRWNAVSRSILIAREPMPIPYYHMMSDALLWKCAELCSKNRTIVTTL